MAQFRSRLTCYILEAMSKVAKPGSLPAISEVSGTANDLPYPKLAKVALTAHSCDSAFGAVVGFTDHSSE